MSSPSQSQRRRAVGGRPLGGDASTAMPAQHSNNGIAGGNRRIGAALTPSHHSNKSNIPLVLFRIIAITIIALCVIWAYLLVKIVTDDESSGVVARPNSLLASRPHIHAPDGRSRIGWMMQQKIDRMKLQMHPAPLLDVSRMDSPILIITCKRADYLERTLWKVFQYHPSQSVQQRRSDLRSASANGKGEHGRVVGAPVIVSQDGSNAEVRKVIEEYRQLFEMRLGIPLYRIEHTQEIVETPDYEFDWSRSYKLLAKHYGWALEQTFSGSAYGAYQKHERSMPTPPPPERVIILEEDIEIAMDFFSLMNSTADLLDEDDTLLAVSAFNDNGKDELVADTKRLMRSDFFPGLGWMMSRKVWDGPPSHPTIGLKIDWAPGGFWDDWLRENERRWGRHIIRPEVSRTFHFGNVQGASDGENNNILSSIELMENDVHWEKLDLSYLDAARFANNYWERVSNARLVKSATGAKNHVAHGDVRLVYTNFDEFERLATEFNIMQDEKAGVPRTGYEGIVEIRYGRGKFFVFLTSPYVKEGGSRPKRFGAKAWMQSDKDSLMKDLGIEKFEEPPAWPVGWP